MDRQLTREEARMRNPVITGEDRNRRYFENSFTKPKWNSADYNKSLLQLTNGEEIHLTPDRWDAIITAWDHIENNDIDEHLATGTSVVDSIAHDGFRAIRIGDRVHVFGTVEHRWDDRYDFGERSIFNVDGPLGAAARNARDYGSAREYETHSGWFQQFRAEYRIVDGQLVPVNIEWDDTGKEVALRLKSLRSVTKLVATILLIAFVVIGLERSYWAFHHWHIVEYTPACEIHEPNAGDYISNLAFGEENCQMNSGKY